MTGIGAALAAAALAGGSAQAATCWQPREVAAARVRQMQTMLMVATLRCRAGGVDIVAAYDGFVTGQATAIAAANLVIKEHFANAGGGQSDYDRFATSLANTYGDDDTDAASCAEAAATARDGVAAAGEALDRLAADRLFPAALPGGRCDAPPVVLAAAAPAPTPAPTIVTLPDDVVAALGVMARYRAAPAPGPAAVVAVR